MNDIYGSNQAIVQLVVHKRIHNLTLPVFRSSIYWEEANRPIRVEQIARLRSWIRRYPLLQDIMVSVDTMIGLIRIWEFAEGDGILAHLHQMLDQNPSLIRFVKDDLLRVAKMQSKQMEEMVARLSAFYQRLRQQIDDPPLTEKQMNQCKHHPETYFRFARAFHYQRVGPTPNAVSRWLKANGYTKRQLRHLISLIHLPIACCTEEEKAWLRQVVEKIQIPESGMLVISQEEMEAFRTGQSTYIQGIWVDESLFLHRSRMSQIQELLRLDQHPMIEKEMYLLRFRTEGKAERCIFAMDEESHWIPPDSLNQGNGFSATRNGEIVPIYRSIESNPVPLQVESTVCGYLNRKGKFRWKWIYYREKWLDQAIYQQVKRLEEKIQQTRQRISRP